MPPHSSTQLTPWLSAARMQSYLSEQGYFHSADGLSGYFGAVTGEALQNWQRDQGLRITGVFNDECKWAYLRQQVRVPAGAARRARVWTRQRG